MSAMRSQAEVICSLRVLPRGPRRTLCQDAAMHLSAQCLVHARFAEWDVMERAASARLDIGRADHLAPLFCFVGNELAKVGGQTREHRAAQVSKARLHLWISETLVYLYIELVNNRNWSVLRATNSAPSA